MAAEVLSAAQFKAEVAKRLEANGITISGAALNGVFRALVDETQDCVVNGYKVSIPGLFSIEPVVKAGRKKGTVIRNPFAPDAPAKTLKADEPDKLAVKIKKSAAITNAFPGPKTNAYSELVTQLKKKPRKKASA